MTRIATRSSPSARPIASSTRCCKTDNMHGRAGAPQVLITMAAPFGRVSWKYSGFAYSLVLKHVGVVMQTLYLMTTEIALGSCAIGIGDIDLFSRHDRGFLPC